jgi:membrane-bound lytic murein transglycosylase B
MAPVSPDLVGLPDISRELAAIPVSGRAVEVALGRYEAADGQLTLAQSRRTAIDRSSASTRAHQRRLESELAIARARQDAARSRLDQVEAAIAELGIDLYVHGGSTARLDAALVAEQPSINDEDRRQVLGSASLDVLLAEQAAYQARFDEAADRAASAAGALQALRDEGSAAGASRPDALVAEAAATGPVAEQRAAYETARVLGLVDGVDFPLVALDAYHRAAATLAGEQPTCGVQWWALAGISRIEGRHGTYGGSSLDERGDTTRRIIGIQLNGTNETQVVPDTDGGRLDGDPAYDRAVGPMQFIPGTWARFAADGNGDGDASPFNLYDATLAAARYLCRASHGLEADDGLRRAYLAYNHSLAYAESVLGWARSYQSSVELPPR